MRHLLTISAMGDFAEVPSQAAVELTPEFVDRIVELAGVAKKYNLAYVQEWDEPEFLDGEGDEDNEFRSECGLMTVGISTVYWEGVIKHTDTKWETGEIAIEALKGLKEVMKLSRSELMKHVGSGNKLVGQYVAEEIKK